MSLCYVALASPPRHVHQHPGAFILVVDSIHSVLVINVRIIPCVLAIIIIMLSTRHCTVMDIIIYNYNTNVINFLIP